MLYKENRDLRNSWGRAISRVRPHSTHLAADSTNRLNEGVNILPSSGRDDATQELIHHVLKQAIGDIHSHRTQASRRPLSDQGLTMGQLQSTKEKTKEQTPDERRTGKKYTERTCLRTALEISACSRSILPPKRLRSSVKMSRHSDTTAESAEVKPPSRPPEISCGKIVGGTDEGEKQEERKVRSPYSRDALASRDR